MTTEDHLLGGRVRLRQPARGLRAGLDAVLLAAAVPARPGESVLEAGCGSGAAFLCLAARVPGLQVWAVEREAELAELARGNAALNGVLAEVLAADLLDPLLRRQLPRVDHAFANPPYWPAGTQPPDALRAGATHDADLAAWAGFLAKRLRLRGSLTFVLPAARLADGVAALLGAGCGAVEVIPLWPRAGEEAKRVLLRARRGGKGPARLLPGLVLHAGEGFTEEAQAVLRDGGAV